MSPPRTFTSTVATGTAPLVVASTTPVTNLALFADTQLPTIQSAGKVLTRRRRRRPPTVASKIVTRDGSGNFAANQITADDHFIGR